jgi:hypothetical protein
MKYVIFIYIFIYNSRNDAVSASNYGMIDE